MILSINVNSCDSIFISICDAFSPAMAAAIKLEPPHYRLWSVHIYEPSGGCIRIFNNLYSKELAIGTAVGYFLAHFIN